MVITADLIGQKFDRLLVIERGGVRHRSQHWVCRCDCGGIKEVSGSNLKSGNIRSCGCLFNEAQAARASKHGYSRHSVYRVWMQMVRRCTLPEHESYADYGGRGINVCERWAASVENFVADMGLPPPKHMIERVDNDGHYEKSNCKWALIHEQSRNKRNSRFLTHGGRTLCVADWAKESGIPDPTIRKRIRNGWSIENALTR